MRQYAVAYALAALVFLVIDAIWLTSMADRLYRPAIGALMRERYALAPALIFYVIYLAGMLVFAIVPGLKAGSWQTALGYGALLGLLAYATYDLTNQATLRDWPWKVTLADLCWGTFATAVASAASCRLTLWITRT